MNMAYIGMRDLHNLMRWLVLLAAIYALWRLYTGLTQGRAWTEADRRATLWYTIGMDIQLLSGLLLYFVLSPLTRQVFVNFSGVMQSSELRFFAVEHVSLMLVAVILAHVGSVMVRRATEDARRFRVGALWYTLSLLAVLAGTPWWRPLIPGMG